MTSIFSRFELLRTPEWFEDKLFSEQGMSVLCVWEREGWEVPLPPLSEMQSWTRTGGHSIDRAGTNISMSLRLQKGCEILTITSSGPLTNSSVWMASTYEVLMSSLSVEENVQTALHVKIKILKSMLTFALTQWRLGFYHAFYQNDTRWTRT